jgi:hypothetical protein
VNDERIGRAQIDGDLLRKPVENSHFLKSLLYDSKGVGNY